MDMLRAVAAGGTVDDAASVAAYREGAARRIRWMRVIGLAVRGLALLLTVAAVFGAAGRHPGELPGRLGALGLRWVFGVGLLAALVFAAAGMRRAPGRWVTRLGPVLLGIVALAWQVPLLDVAQAVAAQAVAAQAVAAQAVAAQAADPWWADGAVLTMVTVVVPGWLLLVNLAVRLALIPDEVARSMGVEPTSRTAGPRVERPAPTGVDPIAWQAWQAGAARRRSRSSRSAALVVASVFLGYSGLSGLAAVADGAAEVREPPGPRWLLALFVVAVDVGVGVAIAAGAPRRPMPAICWPGAGLAALLALACLVVAAREPGLVGGAALFCGGVLALIAWVTAAALIKSVALVRGLPT